MKRQIVAAMLTPFLLTGCMHTGADKMTKPETQNVKTAVQNAAPAMAGYAERFIENDLWNRPGLSKRDRSLVTVAALISRNGVAELPQYFTLALESGVTPVELSETITHLAFYAGWPNATAAAVIAQQVFDARDVDTAALPGMDVAPLPLDTESESKREKMVAENFGNVSPGVVHYTTDALFRDLWLRPGLAPRDRSLITVSALVTAGQVAQVPYHLNRAMDNGLTQEAASEALTQLAFVAGWPNVFSALPVFKEVFSSRAK